MGSQQLYSLSWGEFGSSLLSTVQVLRTRNEMVDVTLAAGGRIFPAHKLVLSAASPLLMELLKSTHCQHPVLMLAGVTASDLEALLQFMYQGEVSVDPTQLPSLLQAAHCLDIQALSPQTLTDQNTMTPISVPIVMTDNVQETTSTTSVPGNVKLTSLSPSSTLPVRKRKHKQRKHSESDSAKWTVTEVMGGGMAKIQKKDRVSESQMDVSMDNTEEPNCNGEPVLSATGEGKLRCASEQPCICSYCGLVIRQARNLRRHMLNGCPSRPLPDVDYQGDMSESPYFSPSSAHSMPLGDLHSQCSSQSELSLNGVPPSSVSAMQTISTKIDPT